MSYTILRKYSMSTHKIEYHKKTKNFPFFEFNQRMSKFEFSIYCAIFFQLFLFIYLIILQKNMGTLNFLKYHKLVTNSYFRHLVILNFHSNLNCQNLKFF